MLKQVQHDLLAYYHIHCFAGLRINSTYIPNGVKQVNQANHYLD